LGFVLGLTSFIKKRKTATNWQSEILKIDN